MIVSLKAGLYRIWCGVNRLGDSGVHTLGDTSAFVNLAGQLLLTRRGKIRMDGVGIVFEFYIAPSLIHLNNYYQVLVIDTFSGSVQQLFHSLSNTASASSKLFSRHNEKTACNRQYHSINIGDDVFTREHKK